MRSIHGGTWRDQLRESLDGLAGVDVSELPDDEVTADIHGLLAALHQLTAVLSLRVGAFDARALSQADGLRTTRNWLVSFGRMSQGAATGWLTRARLMRALPALSAAAMRGDVSAEHLSKVDALARRVGLAETAPFDEILAELSSRAHPAETRRACERIAAHLDPDGAKPDPERDHARRELTFSRLGSMLYVKGRLDAEGGAALMTAVDALMRPPGPDDARTAAQRRADALVDLARTALRNGDLPTVGGVRPQIGILLTPDALLGRTEVPPFGSAFGGGAPTDVKIRWARGRPVPADHSHDPADSDPEDRVTPRNTGEPERPGRPESPPDMLTEAGIPPLPEPPWMQWIGDIPDEVAQRVACDADVWRLVLDPTTGMPLDVGRAHRIVPHWIRRAVLARDRECRWPGCDSPAPWNDVHHLTPWYVGGETNVGELIGLCRWHHVRVHEGRWAIDHDPNTGEVWVTRPDGTPYELGPSRPSRGRGNEPPFAEAA